MLPESIRTSGKITAGASFDNPPTIYVDVADASKALGIAPELATAVGELLGITVEWQNTQWPGQLPGLDSGTLDVIWGQATQTEEREREIIDMVPFMQYNLGFLVEAGNPEGITDWASACGMKVGVSLGSSFVTTMNEASAKYCEPAGKPAMKPTEFQGSEETALRAGSIDATLDAFPVLAKMAEADPDDLAAVEMPEAESFEFYSGMAGVGVSKAQPGLSRALAGAFQELAANGEYQKILKRHDSGDNQPADDMLAVNPLTGTPAGETVK